MVLTDNSTGLYFGNGQGFGGTSFWNLRRLRILIHVI